MAATTGEKGESLTAILEELSELIGTARAMPMSASVLVNRAQVLELIDSARGVVPAQIEQAERIRDDAEGIVARAKAHAEELVDNERVVALAHQRADEIIAEAEAKAEQLALEADDYCDRELAKFEVDLERISSQVAAGRARLQERNPGEEQ